MPLTLSRGPQRGPAREGAEGPVAHRGGRGADGEADGEHLKGLLVGVSKPVVTGAAPEPEIGSPMTCIWESLSNDWFRHPCYRL